MSSTPTLWYSDVSGVVDAIRFTFVLGGTAFNDRRLSKLQAVWKQQFPMQRGSPALLQIEDETFGEPRAILKYAAKLAHLMPQECVRAEMIEGLVYDACLAARNRGGQEVSESTVQRATAKLIQLDELLSEAQDDQGHCVGGTLSYVDVLVATAYSRVLGLETVCGAAPPDTPHIGKTRDLIYNDPRIKMFRNHNPESLPKLSHAKGCWRAHVLINMARLTRVECEVEEISESSERLLPELRTTGSYTISGLHAILTWLSTKSPLFTCSVEDSCKIWSIVDLVGNLWDTMLTGIDPEENVHKQLSVVNSMILRTRGAAGTVAASDFTAADIVLGSFYEYVTSHKMKYQLNGRLLAAFRQSYLLMAQAPAFSLASWANCPVVPELYYYNTPGRAEPIRLAFHISGLQFKDVRFDLTSKQQYQNLSATSKWPILKVGDKTYYESKAILKMVAEWTGLTPLTLDGIVVAEAVNSVADGLEEVYHQAFALKSQEEVFEVLHKHIPAKLDMIEKILKHYPMSKFGVVENRLTWIDLLLSGSLTFLLEMKVITEEDMKSWSQLSQVHAMVYAHPNVKKYLESLGPYMTWC
eukprot:Gregarina_sp_Pseudo_9__40@NODE_1027_length_1959_cov_132_091667_g963_i0_p1_GENE_NODE_1027_length_1959_cov_132_091667_g963_i0NODE_1027_length_1959_cov_132_091667_g963_i0_p1_ORF_typecomplete_len584_score99_23GST_C_3/PF14497_6/0_00022GST_C_3/PF14497_6/94GST_C_3/PF14497_6/2_8e09GST_N/PF02798_20/88GST_N/PF02798_20/1_3e09GST_C/PF00043_25/0_05GST_C/PF00043_25/7_3GST_C/PF00043_25/0_78GST_N_3/PF13417_6/2_2e02GST_N_3/PF13417_6/1e03GST_N_3/PF13417_6/0_00013GST_C_2/PF13410_6/0_041GST_C_2/PF13410_6/19GST_C_2/